MIGGSLKELKKNNIKNGKLPEEIVSLMEETLPKGIRIVYNEKSGYTVIPGEGFANNKILNVTLQFDQDLIKELKEKNISNNEFAEYLYRTQKEINVIKAEITDRESKEACPIEVTFGDPFSDNKELKDMKLIPTEFPPAKTMRFGLGDGNEIEIAIQRVPYADMYISKLENVNFNAIKIEFYYDEKEKLGWMNYSVTPTDASSVKEAVEALKLFVQLSKGEVIINGEHQPIDNSRVKVNDNYMEDALLFWGNALELERVLNISFDPKANFTNEDAELFTELYISLVQGKNIKYEHPFDHFTVGKINLLDNNKEDDIIGTQGVYFKFVGDKATVKLLGTEFEICYAVCMTGLVVTSIEKNEDGSSEVYIKDDGEKPWRLIRRAATSEDKAKEILEEWTKSRIVKNNGIIC